MLIIDGPDSIGKTTLAKRLVKMANERLVGTVEQQHEQVKITYRHMTRPSDSFDYFNDFHNLILGANHTVQDRFHLGTIAYDDPNPKYSRDQLRIIESWIYRQGSVIILLLPTNLNYYKERLIQFAKEEMFDVERMVKAATVYQDIANREVDEVSFGILPSFDYELYHVLGRNGEILQAIGAEYTRTLNSILDTWFKRISWARKIK